MNIDDIRGMRTSVGEDKPNTPRWHESVMRSYQILEKVKWMIEKGTPLQVIDELILLMETRLPQSGDGPAE